MEKSMHANFKFTTKKKFFSPTHIFAFEFHIFFIFVRFLPAIPPLTARSISIRWGKSFVHCFFLCCVIDFLCLQPLDKWWEKQSVEGRYQNVTVDQKRYSHMYNGIAIHNIQGTLCEYTSLTSERTSISTHTHTQTDGRREIKRERETFKSQKLTNFYTYPIRCSMLYGKFYSDYTHWSAHRNNTCTLVHIRIHR